MPKPKPQIRKLDTVTFRPKASDGYQDFKILRADAEHLYKTGKIAMDMTNGGYCPIGDEMPLGFKKMFEVK